METKETKKQNKKYTKEFKVEAVKLVLDQAMSANQVATDLGVGSSTLCKWVKTYKQNGLNSFPGKGRLLPHEEEIRKLQKDLRQTQMERDILKKAISFFAQSQK